MRPCWLTSAAVRTGFQEGLRGESTSEVLVGGQSWAESPIFNLSKHFLLYNLGSWLRPSPGAQMQPVADRKTQRSTLELGVRRQPAFPLRARVGVYKDGYQQSLCAPTGCWAVLCTAPSHSLQDEPGDSNLSV